MPCGCKETTPILTVTLELTFDEVAMLRDLLYELQAIEPSVSEPLTDLANKLEASLFRSMDDDEVWDYYTSLMSDSALRFQFMHGGADRETMIQTIIDHERQRIGEIGR